MPGYLLHENATVLCFHGAKVNAITSSTRVKVSNQAAVKINDTFVVTGCPFTLPTTPPKPQPCVKVQWLRPAMRVLIEGQPALLQDSFGICLSAEQIPQGSPNIVMTQTRVRGL